MTALRALLSRLALPLLALGLAAIAAGAVLEWQGIALPPLLGSTTAFGIMARIGGGIALAGLLFLALTALAEPEPTVAAQEQAEQEPEPAPEPSVTPRRMAEWQRRLAEKAAAAEPEPAPPPPAARGIGRLLHKAALAVVGVAFVGLLGMTLWNQLAPGLFSPAAAPAPQVVAMDDRPAEVLTDAAAPKGHWTDIDVTPLRDWALDRVARAMAGDRTAILQLAGIGAGVVFAVFALFLYFALRSVTSGRKRPRDIAAMGI